MRPRSAASAAPNVRAVAAGTGALKKIHTWAPIPDRDTSNAAGTLTARAAFKYDSASSMAAGPSKSAASQRHVSPSSSG
jgi:hypothetical protein